MTRAKTAMIVCIALHSLFILTSSSRFPTRRSRRNECSGDPNADPYVLLNLNQSVDTNEINRAFRKLSRMYHPDRHADKPQAVIETNEAMFKKLGWARDLLVDENKRRMWDDETRLMTRTQNQPQQSNTDYWQEQQRWRAQQQRWREESDRQAWNDWNQAEDTQGHKERYHNYPQNQRNKNGDNLWHVGVIIIVLVLIMIGICCCCSKKEKNAQIQRQPMTFIPIQGETAQMVSITAQQPLRNIFA